MSGGLHLTLISTDGGFSHRVHAIGGDGSGLRRVTDRRAEGRPAFAPDGLSIVFPGPLTDDSDGRYGLWLVRTDGSGLRSLTAPRAADLDPAWSPDGRRLAFVRDPLGAMDPSRYRLLTMPAGGGAQAQLVATAGARDPAWSPDSQRLAFVANGSLYVVDADGSSLRQVLVGGARFPAWSPDGSTIAYVQRLSAERSRLMTVLVAGGSPTMRFDPGMQVEDPGWELDGQTLRCLVHSGQGWEGRTGVELRRVSSDGTSEFVATFAPRAAVRLATHVDPAPPAPSTLLASEVTQRTARLTWTNPPVADLARSEVRVRVGPTPPATRGEGFEVYRGLTPDAFVTGLAPTTTYSFSVFAVDADGNASPPATTVIVTPPPGPPSAPEHAEAVPGEGSVRVSWTPHPNDGGRPLVGFTVTTDDGRSVDVPATATSTVLTGFASGSSHSFTVSARNDLGPSAPTPTNAVVPDTGGVAGTFTALTPQRLLDTRVAGGALTGGVERTLPVLGRGGVPGTGVQAVALSVAVTGPVATGHLAVWPAGTARPNASVLNYVARQTVANSALVGVGSGGAVTLSATGGATHAVADVTGFHSTSDGPGGGRLNALAPHRVLDTRRAGGGGALGPGAVRTVVVAGLGPVPPSPQVSSVVLVVTAVTPSAATHFTVFPGGEALPSASALNAGRGETTAVTVIARTGADGSVSVRNAAGTAHLIVDVVGYHTRTPSQPGERFRSLNPARILDTRFGVGARRGEVSAEEVIDVTARGSGGVPADARSVLLVVTVVAPSAATHVTVYPADRRPPDASSLNTQRGRTRANLVLAKLDGQGHVALRNQAGRAHLLADVVGCWQH